jgi:hypothetical protein
MPSVQHAVSQASGKHVTQASVAEVRQERQLIAGRYRLASFHRGDETTEVWRALDESTTQVVSLEFLRDPKPESKERFLAGARRLASVAQPSVMRVAAIHDDRDATFIVFEHLVHIPVPIEWLKPAVEAPSPILSVAVPAAAVEPTPTPATPSTLEVVPEDPAALVVDEKPTDRGLSLLLFALRTRELSLIDVPLVQESAIELAALIGSELKAVRVDPDLLPDAGAALARTARRLVTFRPSVHIPAPRISRPQAVRTPRVKAVKPPKPPKPPKQAALPRVAAAPRAPRASRGLGLRIRWGRVLTRGLSLGVLAAILIALPSEMIGNVGNMANDLSVAIREKLAAAVPSAPALQKAAFEVPPLSAYGATFEAQAPYPRANPSGTVEWVVALRNTGSAGWYRGIDGAQASLTLADGTTAGVQTTAYVGPGQVGWFIVHFTAPSQAGTSKIELLPRIDGRGSLPDLGIYATVTVSPNP